jgi:hypothetical protein
MPKPEKTPEELLRENRSLKRRLMESTAPASKNAEPLKLDPKATDRFRRPYEGQ